MREKKSRFTHHVSRSLPMKIAYILKMYPRFSETFIINEILELERRGVDVRIYSLRKPDDGRFHAELALSLIHI